MNRFYIGDTESFLPNETLLTVAEGVHLYQGSDKTRFKNGALRLTSHRLLWGEDLILDLSSVSKVVDEEAAYYSLRSDKIALSLLPPSKTSQLSQEFYGEENVVKLAFKSGGMSAFIIKLVQVMKEQQWKRAAPGVRRPLPVKKIRSGIGGIEKSILQRTKDRDRVISKAFQDLDQLMEMAKPMVALAKSISNKIREKTGDVSEDEAIQFKSYLLSLGISDPVTRESHGSGQQYFVQLAKEIHKILEIPLKECSGTITLTDAFCRVNRARGMELLSPEDLLSACKLMSEAQIPLSLKTFDSGVSVLVSFENEEEIKKSTLSLIEQNTSLSAEELSRLIGLSVVLSKERLLSAEKNGLLCRDDSIHGLRFFQNKFLLET